MLQYYNVVYVYMVLLMTSEKGSKPIGLPYIYKLTLLYNIKSLCRCYYWISELNQITWPWACLWIYANGSRVDSSALEFPHSVDLAPLVEKR